MKKNYSELYQYSTIASISAGNYDGSITFEELLKHGDFGIGTFDHLDGELIVLDGQAYQSKSDGSVHRVKPEWTSPYTILCFFKTNQKFSLNQTVSFDELGKAIDKHLPSKNIFYAIKISGHFDEISTRTVSYQNKPYLKLLDATKSQGVTKFENICGFLVGFRTPTFANSIGVNGYHLHFLDENKSKGGHVFNFKLVNPVVEVTYLSNIHLVLPTSEEYLNSDLENKNLQADIHVAERDRA